MYKVLKHTYTKMIEDVDYACEIVCKSKKFENCYIFFAEEVKDIMKICYCNQRIDLEIVEDEDNDNPLCEFVFNPNQIG